MAVVYANAQGQIQGLRHNHDEEVSAPIPSNPAPAYVLRFDEATNAGILTGYDTNSAQFSMPGGTLTQTVGGVSSAVTIHPPGLLFQAIANADALVSKAKNTTDPFTREEQAQILAVAFHAAGFGV